MAPTLYIAQINIVGAQGLKASDFVGTSDPYAVVKYGGLLLARTVVRKKTLNPDWGQTFVVGPLCHRREIAVEVWDSDQTGCEECLGCVTIVVDKPAICSKRMFPLKSRPCREKEDSDIVGQIILSFDIRPVQSEAIAKTSSTAALIIEKSHSLLKRGPPKKEGSSIDLHTEVENNNLAVLLKAVTPDNVNMRNSRQETLIHKACSSGNLDIVKHLVENKADVNLQDRSGWTPLHCAASCGYFKICEYLVENNAGKFEIYNSSCGGLGEEFFPDIFSCRCGCPQ